jgi:hypothetical protein
MIPAEESVWLREKGRPGMMFQDTQPENRPVCLEIHDRLSFPLVSSG